MLGLGKVLFYRNRKIFWENSNSRIPFGGFAEIPISMVSIYFYGPFFPSLLSNFGLVDANYVWFWFFQITFQVFFVKHWSDSIDVPRGNKKFIRCFSSSILPIRFIRFSMQNIGAFIELLWPGLDYRLVLCNLFWEKFGLLFFFFLLKLFGFWFWFLIIFFWRHCWFCIKIF